MTMTQKPEDFVTAPAVFAVKDDYLITVPVKCRMLFWVEVNGEEYFDHSNGILRSDKLVHRVAVPVKALDEAGEYTVCYKKIIERKPYYTESEEVKSLKYSFHPVTPDGKINIYHISDTHGNYSLSKKAGDFFGGDIDLLILGGDILDHSGKIENFELAFRLCEDITRGEHPCVFVRGNHDLRGIYAEMLEDYFPVSNGKSYYTFRLGKIWGLVLDCGEDKADSNEEYGNTVCCSSFRKEETAFLKEITKDGGYLDNGIEYKLVLVHNPFTYTLEPPFDIEQKLYKEWADILNDGIKPDLMISGHLHDTAVSEIGGEYDTKGQPCPVIIGSRYVKDENGNITEFVGCAITLDKEKAEISFNDSKLNVLEKYTLNV